MYTSVYLFVYSIQEQSSVAEVGGRIPHLRE